jgi:hypothetical protein
MLRAASKRYTILGFIYIIHTFHQINNFGVHVFIIGSHFILFR